MAKSRIEWTESTWNPITGCDKISAGCVNCYAHRMAMRLKSMGTPKYENGFQLTLHEDSINDPYTWKKPKLVFVNSMSDFLHKDVPLEFIQKLFKVMNDNQMHTFQLLTKRPERFIEIQDTVHWSDNIWLGVTCENKISKYRIDLLRDMPAKVKFLSIEPLLECLGEVNLEGIHWAIVGGESGPNSRVMLEPWVINIKDQCDLQDTMFYFKQWGGTNKKKSGRELLGQTWDDMPKI